MTVNQNPSISPVQLGNGVNRTWNFGFKVREASHLYLYLTYSDGTTSQITGFSISQITGLNSDLGGTITYPVAPAAALPTGTTVRVYRQVPFNQPNRIGNQGSFFPELHENTMDLLAMQIQQLRDIGSINSVRAPDFELMDMVLPSANSRAGKMLSFDEAGESTTVVSLSDIIAARDATLQARDEMQELYNDIVATGGIVSPKFWFFTGDGISLSYTALDAEVQDEAMYQISIDGLIKRPGIDFTFDFNTKTFLFDSIPPNGSSIYVVLDALVRPVVNTLPIASGGTGASSSTNARTNLDVYSKGESIGVYSTRSAIAALPVPAAGRSVALTADNFECLFIYRTGDFSAQITAGDTRYIATSANPTGSAGAWVQAGATPTGDFTQSGGARIHRFTDRVFIGDAAGFSGETNLAAQNGISQDVRKYHPWAPRDGGLIVESNDGSMAIVGLSETAKGVNFWAAPSAYPAAFGVSGLVINNATTGLAAYNPAWAGYFDAKRLNFGFTVGAEIAVANLSNETVPNVFNLWTGGHSAGVGAWMQVGGGLDIVSVDYTDWNNIASYETYLSSYNPGGGKTAWANSTVYEKGYVAADGYGGTNYVCRVAHTSPSTGTFAAARAANPSHWAVQTRGTYADATVYNAGDMLQDPVSRVYYYVTTDHTSSGATFAAARTANPSRYKPQPAARVGRVVHVGSLVETSPGSNTFVVDALPLGGLYVWQRDSGTTDASGILATTAAFLGATHNAQNVGLMFGDGVSSFTGRVASNLGFSPPNVNSTVPTTFDWYEEGTATLGVAINSSSTGITYTANSATWTRVGNQVTLRGRIILLNKGSNTGAVTITGLPFGSLGPDNLTNSISVGWYSGFASGINAPPHGFASGFNIALYKNGAGTSVALVDTDITNTSRIEFSITYRVA